MKVVLSGHPVPVSDVEDDKDDDAWEKKDIVIAQWVKNVQGYLHALSFEAFDCLFVAGRGWTRISMTTEALPNNSPIILNVAVTVTARINAITNAVIVKKFFRVTSILFSCRTLQVNASHEANRHVCNETNSASGVVV